MKPTSPSPSPNVDRQLTIDARILSSLRLNPATPVSGTELSRQIGISRTAVWAHIEELRALGYDIQASPHHGYRLLAAPDRLHTDDLISRLAPVKKIGRDIRVFQQTGSTNDIVERMARDGAKEGVVVFAEAQSGGKGRLGRKWFSPPHKGLWLSLLLRPKLRPEAMPQLTIAAAAAVARSIAKVTPLTPLIKWPNDVMIHNRKTGGILLEMSAELDSVKYAVLGIGLNVNLTATDLPPELRKTATSLRIEAETPIDRAALAAELIHQLDQYYHRLGTGHFESIAAEWAERCSTLGQHVAVRSPTRTWEGTAESLDADGALLLRTQHGRLERIIGGDITLTG